jgi:hypothetical protein
MNGMVMTSKAPSAEAYGRDRYWPLSPNVSGGQVIQKARNCRLEEPGRLGGAEADQTDRLAINAAHFRWT